jgi:nitrogen fixation-related uncharacterized protein
MELAVKVTDRELEIKPRRPKPGPRFAIFDFRISQWLMVLSAIVGTLSTASVALAQGCAMCYTSAAAAKAGAIQALRSGILILLVPVVLMCGVIAMVIFRRRNQFDEDMDWTEEEDRELRSLFARMGPVEQQEAGSREVESHSPVS